MPDWLDNVLVLGAIAAALGYCVWKLARGGRKSSRGCAGGCCSRSQTKNGGAFPVRWKE